MPQVKRFKAKRNSKLDCGHTVKEGETIVVTTTYGCERDQDWPLSVLRASFEAVLARFENEARRSSPESPSEG
jgi:hypothetical protein